MAHNNIKCALYSPMWPTQVQPGFGSFTKSSYESLRGNQKFSKISITHCKTDLSSKKYWRALDILFTTIKFVLKNAHFDIWYVHYLPITAPIFVIFAYLLKKPLIFNFHGDEITSCSIKCTAIRNITFLLFKSLRRKAVIVPSAYFHDVVSKICKNKNIILDIFISPSGGVPDDWIKEGAQKAMLKQVSACQVRLGYIGRLDPGKNWKLLFPIIDVLKMNQIEASAIVCGWGKEKDDLDAFCLKKGYNIKIIPGVERKELIKVYKNIDLLLFWSDRPGESLGLVGLEALAFGVPVIVSPFFGPSTYITHEVNGFILQNNSIDNLSDLAGWVRKIISDKTAYSHKCSNSVLKYAQSNVGSQLADFIYKFYKNEKRNKY